jgi:hypothetical protein
VQIIKSRDPEVLAFASLVYAKSDNSLPGTPFVVTETRIDETGSPEVGSIRVRILSKLNPFPPELTKIIKSEVARFGTEPQLNFEPLLSPEKATEAEEEVAGTTTEEKPKSLEDLKDPKKWEQWAAENPLMTVMTIVVAAIGLILLLLGLFYLANSLMGKRAMSQGFKQMADAFAENGGGGAVAAAGGGATGSSEIKMTGSGAGSSAGGGDDSPYKTFPIESLKALMSDAYWGQYDGFASYLWKRIPIERKQEILDSCNFLRDYVKHLVKVEEDYVAYDQEPYYLNPLPLNHLSMKDLTKLVREQASLLNALPVMRVQALELPSPELIRMVRDLDDSDSINPEQIRSANASPLRDLERNYNFKINSVEEELEILAIENLSPSQQKQIPTLAWLARLPDIEIEAILAGFMAQDLALAWVGPEDVLEKLASHLPLKKLALVLNYVERTAPNRDSEAFQSLYKRGADLLFAEGGLKTPDTDIEATQASEPTEDSTDGAA